MFSILRRSASRWATCIAKRPTLRSFATRSEKEDYTTKMQFTSLADSKPIPVFRTVSDTGVSLQGVPSEMAFSKELALSIYRVMLRLNLTDALFYEAQRQVPSANRILQVTTGHPS